MAAPGYSYLTLGTARVELANRLEDPNCVYWTTTELNELIVHAIHAWQALTGAYKQRGTFTISPGGGVGGSSFYDLNQSLGLLNFFITDQDVINIVLEALMEPLLTPTWVGTGQYSWNQIVYAVQNRINRWLEDSGANVTRGIAPVGAGESPFYLSEATLDVRRGAWVNTAGAYSTLWRDDEYAMQAFYNPGWITPKDPPMVWGKFTPQPVGVTLYPPPLNAGQLETLVVTSGPQIGTTPAIIVATPTVLDIPEDFAWGIIAGALSDLCSADGQARDPDRALYAEQRYQESVELYRLNPTLLMTRINNAPIWSGSVFEMDSFLASWQVVPGPPQFAGMCDRNLCAFGPTPDAAYTVTMDVVGNIPVPVSDTDYIQVDRGALDPLLDYAFHMASFKMAGAEWKATEKLRKNFYAAAALENSRLTRANFYRAAFQLPATRQQSEVPRI